MKKFFQLQLLKKKLSKQVDLNSSNVPAYSLVEIMVVIVLVGCITLISIAAYQGTEQAVRSELTTLSIVISYMRQTAMTSFEPQHVSFDLKNHSYTYRGIKHVLRNAEFGFIPGIQGPPSHPHRKLTQAVTCANHTITFSQQGIISAGTIYMTNKNHTCTYALTVPVGYSSLKTYRWDNLWGELS